MSLDDRPATRAFKDRWSNLLAFWKERRRGPYDRDFTEWRMDMGLTPRTARENYWDAGQTLGKIRVVFEKRTKYWEYLDQPGDEEAVRPKRKLSAKAEEFFEKCRIKEKMKAGPCKDRECPPFAEEEGCQHCTAYVSYTGKFEEPEEDEE